MTLYLSMLRGVCVVVKQIRVLAQTDELSSDICRPCLFESAFDGFPAHYSARPQFPLGFNFSAARKQYLLYALLNYDYVTWFSLRAHLQASKAILPHSMEWQQIIGNALKLKEQIRPCASSMTSQPPSLGSLLWSFRYRYKLSDNQVFI